MKLASRYEKTRDVILKKMIYISEALGDKDNHI